MVKFDFGVYAEKIRERYSIPNIKSEIYKIENSCQASHDGTDTNEETHTDISNNVQENDHSHRASEPSVANKDRPRNTITKCSHVERKHYAKGLCR